MQHIYKKMPVRAAAALEMNDLWSEVKETWGMS